MYTQIKNIKLTDEELAELHQRVDADIEERVQAAADLYDGEMPVHNKAVLRNMLFRQAVKDERLALHEGQDYSLYDDADGVPGQRD